MQLKLPTNLEARVTTETLTDGSIVFNVYQGSEEIFCAASWHEADAYCQDFNERRQRSINRMRAALHYA